MEEFKKRLVEEYSDLADRTDKLAAFLPTAPASRLDPEVQDLLRLQLMYMRNYRDVLGRRMELIDLVPE